MEKVMVIGDVGVEIRTPRIDHDLAHQTGASELVQRVVNGRQRDAQIGAGGLGMKIDLSRVPLVDVGRNDTALFSESQSRFVVTVNPENQRYFERVMDESAIDRTQYVLVGEVTADTAFVVAGLDGSVIIRADIHDLKEAWQKPLRW